MTALNVTERLARAAARRPWPVVGLWLALFLVGAFLAAGVGDTLTSEFSLASEPESIKARQMIEERLRGPKRARELIIIGSNAVSVEDPAFRSFVEELLADVRGLDGVVESATSFYESVDPTLVSADRHKTLLPVLVAGEEAEAADTVAPLVELVEEADGQAGFEVLTGGAGSIERTFNELSEQDLQRGEMIGVPIALLILVLVFGAVVAAGVPVVLAVVSIAVALGAVAMVGRAFELNFLVVNMVTMVGLALGIDYSLFIVHRFREERRRGFAKQEAITRAGATASRAVLFSGSTVVVALMGLFVVPSSVFRSLAIGAIFVALFAVLAALTLLPAVLSLIGDRVNALRLPLLQRGSLDGDQAGFWGRVTAAVMARPVLSAAAAIALLLAAAVPLLGINTGFAGVSTFPEDAPARRAFAILQTEFSAGLIAPAEIAVDAANVNAPAAREGIERLLGSLEADESFGPAAVESNQAGDLALVSVLINGDPSNQAARDAVQRLRDVHIPAAFEGVEAEVLVGGETAEMQDVIAVINSYTPVVFVFVLGLSFILLLVVFRSVVVPIKALIMNLLSVSAAYGLLVLVFQRGWGNEILGFQQTESIAAWLPLFLFAFLFGLSMDYHVFLLSRIRERFDQTGDNAGSVAYGLRTTAGIITGAALIMVAVFSGFAMGDLVELQQVGFGLAVAVILDATIIRTVLVPASMQLLGDLNWYLPRWLAWLPQIAAEGEPTAARRADAIAGD